MNNLKSVNLSKSYTTNEESIDVLHNINLTINLHDQIAISGNSGSGKSTLLHLLAALDTPTSGKICIDDVDISSFSKNELSKHRLENFGFVYQFHHLMEDLTVIENILIPGQLANTNPTEARGGTRRRSAGCRRWRRQARRRRASRSSAGSRAARARGRRRRRARPARTTAPL